MITWPRYCQAILKCWKIGRAPEVDTWKDLVSSLEERLRIYQQVFIYFLGLTFSLIRYLIYAVYRVVILLVHLQRNWLVNFSNCLIVLLSGLLEASLHLFPYHRIVMLHTSMRTKKDQGYPVVNQQRQCLH